MQEDRGYVVDEKLYSEEERKQVLPVLVLILVRRGTIYVSSTLEVQNVLQRRQVQGPRLLQLGRWLRVYNKKKRQDKTRPARVGTASSLPCNSETRRECENLDNKLELRQNLPLDDGKCKFILFSCNKLRD